MLLICTKFDIGMKIASKQGLLQTYNKPIHNRLEVRRQNCCTFEYCMYAAIFSLIWRTTEFNLFLLSENL